MHRGESFASHVRQQRMVSAREVQNERNRRVSLTLSRLRTTGTIQPCHAFGKGTWIYTCFLGNLRSLELEGKFEAETSGMDWLVIRAAAARGGCGVSRLPSFETSNTSLRPSRKIAYFSVTEVQVRRPFSQ